MGSLHTSCFVEMMAQMMMMVMMSRLKRFLILTVTAKFFYFEW